MESLKKLGTKCSSAFVSGLEFSKKAKRPSQEALEQNGIRVDILFNVHCSNCEKEFRKCCESMPGLSEVDIDDQYVPGSTKLATHVTGVFDPEKLVRRIWKKCSKKVEISKQEKIGGGGGGNGSGADGEGNEKEEDEGEELEIKEDHDH